MGRGIYFSLSRQQRGHGDGDTEAKTRMMRKSQPSKDLGLAEHSSRDSSKSKGRKPGREGRVRISPRRDESGSHGSREGWRILGCSLEPFE